MGIPRKHFRDMKRRRVALGELAETWSRLGIRSSLRELQSPVYGEPPAGVTQDQIRVTPAGGSRRSWRFSELRRRFEVIRGVAVQSAGPAYLNVNHAWCTVPSFRRM